MACPICGGDRVEVLTTIAFETLPDFPLPDRYEVAACEGCGFVYNESGAGQAVYDGYYSSMSKYDTPGISGAGGLSEIDREKYEGIASFLLPHVPSMGAAVIDIGCAKGGLLAVLREKGLADLSGLDPSTCHGAGPSEAGFRLFAGSLFDFRPPRPFDVALFTSVLEHVRDLRTAAEKLASSLAPGGLLLIEVPDASRYADFGMAPFYRFDFEHINHFSAPHVENLMAPHGFEPVASLRVDVRVSGRVRSPAILCLLRKTGRRGAVRRDPALRDAVAKYVAQSEARESFEAIDGIVDSRIPLCVWGLGAHTCRLLRKSRLARADIRAFVDNDPHKKGKRLLGKPIVPSSAIPGLDDGETAMAIGSVLYAEEMTETLKKSGWKGKIVSLV